ncbi:PQQ-binding-like beta-propeller repeat protein [Halomicroarcula sp. F28]|uniref:outer membrane protein assembly factor BamB family protein n=1 Tax=Haloarcula salinisoli TaxID=2487746 RepID=UPI001C73CEBC|nr:PQQ-binding-like beta-propeller repeat protein [Halomicroarcula salinisoli]MBX0285597.1 PQQ-binding-like beta-propeller repeat protein [Halomicroarcula salinisoli]
MGRKMLNSTEAGEILWTYETPRRVRSSPTVTDETVFVGNSRGKVYAIDTSNGEKRWSKSLPNGVIKATPAIDSDYVYVGNNYGYFAALDQATGEEAWSISIEGGYTFGGLNSSPLLHQDTVYVGMHDGKLYAIDAASGEIQWAFQTGSPIKTSPIAVDGKICIGSGKDLYAISASDGQEQWVVTEPTEPIKTPTEHEGTLYFGSEDKKVYAIDGADGTVTWTSERQNGIYSTPTVSGDSLYLGLSGTPQAVASLDIETGEEKTLSGNGYVYSSPTVIDDSVYFATESGYVYSVNLDAGEYDWSFRSESKDRIRSSPTIADGVLYVGSDDGTVYAIDAGTSKSSNGSRVNDRSFGYHRESAKSTDQQNSSSKDDNPADTTRDGTETTGTSETNNSKPADTESGISPWVLGAGGSSVALLGYLFGKKTLSGDTESSDTTSKSLENNKPDDTTSGSPEDNTLDLEEPDG